MPFIDIQKQADPTDEYGYPVLATGAYNAIGTGPITAYEYEDVVFRGNKLRSNSNYGNNGFFPYSPGANTIQLAELVIDVSITVSYDQITQLVFKFEDPGNTCFQKGYFDLGGEVVYRGLKFAINACALDGGTSGLGGATVTCRPSIVEDIKGIQGNFNLPNCSPTDYVGVELARVKAPFFVENTAVRVEGVTRDVIAVGTTNPYSHDEIPSAWTTMVSRAQEEGYAFFECYGTIYFTRITFLMASRQLGSDPHRRHNIIWNPASTSIVDTALEMPAISTTYDATDEFPTISVTIKLDLSESTKYILGDAVKIKGVAGINTPLMVSSITYSLAGTGVCTLTCIRPMDPKASIPNAGAVGAVQGSGATNGFASNTQLAVGTYGGENFNSEQVSNASIIYNTALDSGFSQRDAEIAIMTAITESTLHNYKVAVDHDSLGLFQQRPSQGWGTPVQVTDPVYATNKFLSRLKNIPGRATMPEQVVGQTVQGSAFSDGSNYAKSIPYAHAMVLMFSTLTAQQKTTIASQQTVATLTGADTTAKPKTRRATDFTNFALSQRGKTYVFGASINLADTNPNTFDCSLLVQWALYQVGITSFPRNSDAQFDFCTRSGTAIYQAQALKTNGALMFRNGGSDNSGHVGISLGNGTIISAEDPQDGIKIDNANGFGFNEFALAPGMIFP